MLEDFFKQEIGIGDFIVYGAGRAGLQYGLVVGIKEELFANRLTPYYKIKVARCESDRRYIWNHATREGYYSEPNNVIVKTSIHTNSIYTVKIQDVVFEDNGTDFFYWLFKYRDEILKGKKKFPLNIAP